MEIGALWIVLGGAVLIIAWGLEKLNARIIKLEAAVRELNPGLNL